ncbi:MAG TPA: VacJ family lipoprotein [Nitrospiria bacterium]
MGMHQRFSELCKTLILLAAVAVFSFGSPWRAGAEQAESAVVDSASAEFAAPGSRDDMQVLANALDLDEAQAGAGGDDRDQDPWEGFNESIFTFNRQVDRFVLKPIATGWDFVLPDAFQRSLKNAMDNLSFPRRLINNLLQVKIGGAGREVARFTVNSTIGFVGFLDVAKDAFGIQQSDEDTGQTFGVWGIGPGPYLILPFLPPLTVRDGIGLAFDTAMNPMSYFIPFYATAAVYATNVVNERSLNLDKFERVEESVVDLYSAVRNAYLQRRAAAIKE